MHRIAWLAECATQLLPSNTILIVDIHQSEISIANGITPEILEFILLIIFIVDCASAAMQTYLGDLSSGTRFSNILRLLTRWRGSLYKLVYKDLLGYLGIYYVINLVYRFALKSPNQKKSFEEIVKFCDNMKNNIPISFLLGFFVSGVIARWFQLYLYIPYLNRMAFLAEGLVNGGDKEKCLKIRLTLLRYLNLAWILCMRQVSDQIEIRFKHNNSQENYEEYGVRDTFANFNKDKKIQSTYRKIITDAEIRAFENIAAKNYSKNKIRYLPEFWVPIQWSSRLLQKAFVHGFISDPRTLNSIISDLDVLRGQMHILQIFSGIMIPLVYTQVIIIAVYSYFLCQMFASQFVDPSSKITGHEVDLYVPIFTIFQFLFFMGWLKVAMCVMNPFGDDDEDFQTSKILDDNLDVTYRSVTADSYMYPEHLNPPIMWYKEQSNKDEDLLDDFMKDIDSDLEEIELINDEKEVTNFEMKSNKCLDFLKCISCGLCKFVRQTMASPSAEIPASPKKKFFHLPKKNIPKALNEKEREEITDDQRANFLQNV